MVVYLGDSPIAGYSTNTKMNAHSLLDFKWSDHILNELSWVNADTFSWLSGDVYTAVYNKLVAEYDTGTTETETGVSYKKSDNGFKIADASQEQAVINAYNSTGVAWFYILDTANRRFKLPRTKYGFTGLRDGVGKYVPESLPNIRGDEASGRENNFDGISGAFTQRINTSGKRVMEYANSTTSTSYRQQLFDASSYSSTYKDNAPVQQRATQMLLYFYVGEFAQSAVEQTAGITTEVLNGKADVDLSNINASGKSLASGWSMPSDRYIDLTLGASGSSYTAPANGFVLARLKATTNNLSYTELSGRARIIANSYTTGHVNEVFIPVSKGEIFYCFYGNCTKEVFRFFYAEGEN